jgi:NAD(P)-dependent dehydrogenase (short-subunit alcohol dehydrogenase family)
MVEKVVEHMDMKGKVVLITGATSGIGKETALGLAKLGATVAFTTRDDWRGETTRQDIVRLSGGNQNIEPYLCDLASFDSIRRCMLAFQAKHDRLHVLINNAGTWERERTLSKDGVETTWAVNMLAPFLLSSLLLPALEKGAPSRIVNLSSGLHVQGRLDLGDPERANGKFDGSDAYTQSKLAMNLFTFELARRLAGQNITANAVAPGWVATGLSRNSNAFSRGMMNMMASKPSKGALTPVYAASSPELEGVTGKYLKDSKVAEPSPESNDAEKARKLWELCDARTRLQ